MKRIDVKFECKKCQKDINTFYFSEISDELDTPEHRNEVVDYLKFLHDKDEHTHCSSCGKKIKSGDSYTYLFVGWQRPGEKKHPGEIGTMLFKLVCEDCAKKAEYHKTKKDKS